MILSDPSRIDYPPKVATTLCPRHSEEVCQVGVSQIFQKENISTKFHINQLKHLSIMDFVAEVLVLHVSGCSLNYVSVCECVYIYNYTYIYIYYLYIYILY